MARLLVFLLLFRVRVNKGHRTFRRVSELISLLPGNFGLRVRRGFFAKAAQDCAPDVEFGFGTIVVYPNISIGSRVSFGRYCSLGLADFEPDVLVSSNCHFLSGGHIHEISDAVKPIREQAVHRQRIRIGRGAWIGVGAIVMADVGAGAVVGAGAIVTRPVLPYQVVAGNPARVLRTRERPDSDHV